MIALGNDVVDINWSPKNGQAYYSKLATYAFSKSELRLLSNIKLTVGLMLLWSIKEACYKSAVKMGYSNRFKPKEFCIDKLVKKGDFFFSEINHENRWFKGKSSMKSGSIHSITTNGQGDFSCVKMNDQWIESDGYSEQHRAVRNLARKQLSDWKLGNISFAKNESGVPFVLYDEKPLVAEISFSHHGKVVGYALQR